MKKIWFSILTGISIPVFLVLFLYPKRVIKIEEDYFITNELIWSIDSQELTGAVLNITGWVVMPGEEQGYAVLDNKSVWLFDTYEKNFYKLKSKQSSTRNYDVSSFIGDGVDYQSSALGCSVDLSSFDLLNREYIIYLCYQSAGVNYIIQTDLIIKNGQIICEG